MKFLTESKDTGKRLDILLSNYIKELTRSNIKKVIKNNNVKINGKIVNYPSQKVLGNQRITISLIQKDNVTIKPQKIKLDIIFEDRDIIVINKPAGMVVHPGAGNSKDTLVNALIYKYKKNLSDINGAVRPGIVHRLDKHTSGLLVIAKNNLAHSNLGNQFNKHTIERKYIMLIWGVIRPLEGKIITKISRSKKNRQLMEVNDLKGKKAITNYKTIKVFNIEDIPRISLIECTLETGRTHQIRVHMKYKGVYLIGDAQYGKKNLKFRKINKEFKKIIETLSGQALHAKFLGFVHPRNKKNLIFKKEPPKKFKKLLNFLEKLSS